MIQSIQSHCRAEPFGLVTIPFCAAVGLNASELQMQYEIRIPPTWEVLRYFDPDKQNSGCSRRDAMPWVVNGCEATMDMGDGYKCVIDAGEVLSVSGYTWKLHCRDGRYSRYAASTVTCGTRKNKHRKNVLMHRLIIRAAEGSIVDHRNGNGLDNRRANLRLVDASINAINRHTPIRGTSRFNGVNWFPLTGRWRAQIRANSKFYALGYFFREEEAARAYDEAAKKLHGENARLNFPI